MFGLKIFVPVQTFRRVPPVLPCNFCHPVMSSSSALPDLDQNDFSRDHFPLRRPCLAFICLLNPERVLFIRFKISLPGPQHAP